MKSHTLLVIVALFTFILMACQESLVSKFETRTSRQFDLEEFSYFEPEFSRQIKSHSMRTDSLANLKAALGRIIFYDSKLSLNNSVSCATCHQQSKAFADGLQFSTGLFGKQTTRNSMALINLGIQNSFFWDVSGRHLSEDVMKPVLNHIEMGIEDLSSLPAKFAQTSYYEELFEEVYGAEEITEEKISLALAAFVEALYTYHSKYDRGREVRFTNFTVSEEKGMELFFGKAKCGQCHEAPNFTRTWGVVANIGLDKVYKDQGYKDGNFKIPSLRNIELTSPYMHDGRFETLEEVIDHYNDGIQAHKELNWELQDDTKKPIRLNLTDKEKIELLEFLKTLTDYSFLTEERFSNPF